MAAPRTYGRLDGKRAIVIGAGSVGNAHSNGSAVALRFAQEGAAVVCADISEDAARRIADEIREAGGVAHPFQMDVSRKAEVEALMRFATEQLGQVEILHNNVGISIQAALLDVDESDWDTVFNINLKGAMLSNQAALKHMIDRGIPGSITNVSSTASKRWTPMQYLSYTTSKAALNQMTRVNAKQYASHHVRFNVLLPGMIDTPHSEALYGCAQEAALQKTIRGKACPMGRQGTVWEVADAAVFLASDEARYVTGLEMVVDGGLTL